MGRPGTFFRGSELSRLWVLIAVLALGIPFVVILRPRGREEPPPPPVRAGEAELPAPRLGPAFVGVSDKVRMSEEDTPALTELLAEARGNTPAAWAEQARRDVLYTHLWEHPARFRGVALHLEGTALRSLTYDVGPDVSPKRRLYEVWFTTPESHRFPYAVVFEDPPKDFPIGPDISESIRVDGYFLKLLGYQGGDAARAAPLLVGKLTWVRSASPVSSRLFREPSFWTLAPLAILGAYAAVRLIMVARRLQTGRPASRPARRTEPVPQETIAAFLQDLEVPREGADPQAQGPQPLGIELDRRDDVGPDRA